MQEAEQEKEADSYRWEENNADSTEFEKERITTDLREEEKKRLISQAPLMNSQTEQGLDFIYPGSDRTLSAAPLPAATSQSNPSASASCNTILVHIRVLNSEKQ